MYRIKYEIRYKIEKEFETIKNLKNEILKLKSDLTKSLKSKEYVKIIKKMLDLNDDKKK